MRNDTEPAMQQKDVVRSYTNHLNFLNERQIKFSGILLHVDLDVYMLVSCCKKNTACFHHATYAPEIQVVDLISKFLSKLFEERAV